MTKKHNPKQKRARKQATPSEIASAQTEVTKPPHFECQYCSDEFQDETDLDEHERDCLENPNNMDLEDDEDDEDDGPEAA
jgi:hypothetical protein